MIAFSIGSRDIYRYGVFYALSFIAGYICLRYLGYSKIFHKRPRLHTAFTKDLDTLMILIIIGVLLGGRLGYVFIYSRDYYKSNIGEILMLRKGGMAFIGGMIGVIISLGSYCLRKKFTATDFWALFDSILIPVPFGIMLGRLGNFLNQEIYGIPVAVDYRNLPTSIISIAQNLHIFHIYDQVDTVLRLNPNLLASFGEGLLILCILIYIWYRQYNSKRYHAGLITSIFLIMYSSIRFVLEYIRSDSAQEFIGVFTISQYYFIGFFVLGISILWYTNKKNYTLVIK